MKYCKVNASLIDKDVLDFYTTLYNAFILSSILYIEIDRLKEEDLDFLSPYFL